MCESAHPPHTAESKVQGCRSPVLNILLTLCEFLVVKLLLHCESSHFATALWLDICERDRGDLDPLNLYSCSWKHFPPKVICFPRIKQLICAKCLLNVSCALFNSGFFNLGTISSLDWRNLGCKRLFCALLQGLVESLTSALWMLAVPSLL